MKLVSDGFATLRKHIPTTPANKKLSKVETLRTAIEYIKHLQRVLNESNRFEREARLLRQVGWLQGAYDLPVTKGFVVLLNNHVKHQAKLAREKATLVQESKRFRLVRAFCFHSSDFHLQSRFFKKSTGHNRSRTLGDRPSKTVNLVLEKVIKFTPVFRREIRLPH